MKHVVRTALHPGDKCWVRAGLVRHYGIYAGRGADNQPRFIHNTPKRGVALTALEDFARGRPIHIEQRARPGTEREVVERALSLIGKSYDLLNFNCEHLANFAASGRAESRQVQTGFTLVGFGLAGFVLFGGALSDDTWVDANGYRRDRRGRFA